MSTTEPKENLMNWLRDAHAMEQQAETMLNSQSSRLEHYPVLKDRIDQHIRETQGQQQRLETCIERLGGSPSAIKDMGGKVMAFAQGMSGMAMSDEVVKGAMSGYVFEHMEIASYTILIAAAKAAGDLETQQTCEQNLREEEAMAEWLLHHLPEVTQAFISRSANPDTEAKR